MTGFFVLLSSLLFSILYSDVAAQSRTNFVMKRLELCRPNTMIKFDGNITDENNSQFITFDAVLPIPLDENVGYIGTIESMLTNKTIVRLFTIHENSFCQAANKYLGEFWYDLERAAQVLPKACPIRAGRYHVHHHLLSYDKISLQTFPFGKLRFTWYLKNNRKPEEILFCLLMEAENAFN